jgi:hypothetical protein
VAVSGWIGAFWTPRWDHHCGTPGLEPENILKMEEEHADDLRSFLATLGSGKRTER